MTSGSGISNPPQLIDKAGQSLSALPMGELAIHPWLEAQKSGKREHHQYSL